MKRDRLPAQIDLEGGVGPAKIAAEIEVVKGELQKLYERNGHYKMRLTHWEQR
jgi:hypothetical protein